MIMDGNMNSQEEIKSIDNGEYVSKYKSNPLFTSVAPSKLDPSASS